MLNPASPLAALLQAPARPGIVRWLCVRPERRAPVQAVASVALDPAGGLAGDHYAGRTGRERQVTLMAAEHLAAIASILGRDALPPELLRRNVVVSGLNPHALRHRRFRLGTALLEATGECHPCSRMEALLGQGGYNAVRGHGGITARILEAGVVSLGDGVVQVE